MSKESILIIEADAGDLEVIAEVVTKLGFPFEIATNYTNAARHLHNRMFPIVISNMESCVADDGSEIMDLIRTVGQENSAFVVMTGWSDDYSFDRVFGAGAQEFIKKPFTRSQVENRLKRIFHERHLSRENIALHKQQSEMNEQLQALLSVASDLTSELDTDRLFPLIVGKISEVMTAERSSLFVIDWERDELWTRVSEGIDTLTIKMGDGISGHVAQTGEVVCVDDAWELPYFNRDYDTRHSFRSRSVLCVPIYNRMGERIAVIEVINKRDGSTFNKGDIAFLNGLGAQVGIALENSLLYDEIRLSFESFIRTLSAVVDARHPLTAGHSQRVTEYSLMIAEQMALETTRLEALKIASLLHDIGKIGIRDDVLLKNGPFTPEEREEMNSHPLKTKEILEKFRFPRTMRNIPQIALCHHEKVNGCGYPMGLTGDDMPLESKIMATADVFDALTSRRDYPKYTRNETFSCDPMPLDKAIDILKNDAGSHFDREVVDAFMKCLPQILLRFRGGHFPHAYVDETLGKMAPEVLNPDN